MVFILTNMSLNIPILVIICLFLFQSVVNGTNEIPLSENLEIVDPNNKDGFDQSLPHRSLVTNGENICKGGELKSLTLRYFLPSKTSSIHGTKSTCVKSNYPNTASLLIDGYLRLNLFIGRAIIISGAIDDRTKFDISGWGKCYIDTSCKVPLVVGDQIGPFVVLDGEVTNPTPGPRPGKPPTRKPVRRPTKVPVLPPGTRNICDTNGKIKYLILQYDLPSATSKAQGSKATCVKSNYPESAKLILGENSFPITDGFQFTIGGTNQKGKIDFEIEGWGKCHIDTSCTVPVLVGDKIGPFLVIDGE
jgi:hypothetical protein